MTIRLGHSLGITMARTHMNIYIYKETFDFFMTTLLVRLTIFHIIIN